MVENEQSFGEYLRQLIKDSGITQHKFYTELGIRKPYFYDILAGRTNPPPYPLQLKAMEILQASNETRERFFDLAAKGRNELPADIARYIEKYVTILTANSVTIPRKSMFGKLLRNDS